MVFGKSKGGIRRLYIFASWQYTAHARYSPFCLSAATKTPALQRDGVNRRGGTTVGWGQKVPYNGFFRTYNALTPWN
jgi:hypothetical protein